MKRITIPRRTVLGGAGGVALGLPALEIMRGAGKALAAGVGCPRRFIVTYLGTSVANCYRYQSYAQFPGGLGGHHDFVTPRRPGPGYESTLGLEPIFKAGVQDVMGIVSGLRIPVLGKAVVPASGAQIGYGFHGRSSWPQLSGVSSCSDSTDTPSGPSADQQILKIVSADTLERFPKGLQLSVTPLFRQTLSYEKPPGASTTRPIAAYTSPREAYNALFGNVTPTPGAGASVDAQSLLARQKSVVDVVKKRAERLIRQLGQGDKIRMERYLDNIRTLETRINTIGPTGGVGGCQLPQPILEDPAKGIETYDTKGYWSEDTRRAQLQSDLIYHAFQCDQTRVVSWMFDGAQSALDMSSILGGQTTLHGATHSFSDPGAPQNMAKAIAWYIKPVADLVSRLKATDDICGGKMIDNTVIVMLLEGGHGRSSDAGFQNADESDPVTDYGAGLRFAHSHENMVLICAGGRNFGLQLGQHIHFNNDRHPAEVMYTLLRALGLNDPFGEISTDVPEIRSLQL